MIPVATQQYISGEVERELQSKEAEVDDE